MNDMSKFISYFEAKQYLDVRFDTTPDEMALWVSIGAEKGGLNAYTINEFEQLNQFSFEASKFIHDNDYIKPLENLYFLPSDIEQFKPNKRYITIVELINRWEGFYEEGIDYDEDLTLEEEIEAAIKIIGAKINESRLFEYHPIVDVDESTGQFFRSGLFDLEDVREAELIQTRRPKKVIDNKRPTRVFDESNVYKMRIVRADEVTASCIPTKEPNWIRKAPIRKAPILNTRSHKSLQSAQYKKFIARGQCVKSPIKNAATAPNPLQYGELELLLDDATSFYPALNLLADDWQAEEFALHVFYGTVRAFEKSGVDGMLRPVINIKDWLIQYGKCLSFDDKLHSIKDALLKFNYSKLELSQCEPKNRYISFQQAQTRLSTLINGDIYDAEKYLIDALEHEKIYAFHYFVGSVTPKLSMDGERWRNGYFTKWQLNRLIARDFGEQETPKNTVKTTEDNEAAKQRKKLIPKERDTNEGLLLLYDIFGFYNINYLDELPGIKAWGRIVSTEFKSELIKNISDTKKCITLNGGDTLNKTDFLEKYRKRFK